jgi:hypothetical protein
VAIDTFATFSRSRAVAAIGRAAIGLWRRCNPNTQITGHEPSGNVLPAMQQVEFCNKRCLDAAIGSEEAWQYSGAVWFILLPPGNLYFFRIASMVVCFSPKSRSQIAT